MDERLAAPSRERRFSPWLLAVALTPAVLQVQYDCDTGDTNLSSLRVEVSEYDQIVGFDPSTSQYDVTISGDTVVVHVETADPAASAYYQLRDGGALLEAGALGVGGGDVTLSIPLGQAELKVDVRPPEGGFRFYTVDFVRVPRFACSEQGILDAIASGGGPHFFDCAGPTTVTTLADIVIDNDVILDGEGNLAVEGLDPQGGTFSVLPGVVSELLELRIATRGESPGRAIRNEGSLTLIDCIVEGDWGLTGIYSDGSLTLRRTVVRNFEGGGLCIGIESVGSLNLVDTTVTGVTASDGHAICSSGSLVVIGSAIVNNMNIAASIYSVGDATLVNSTVSGDTFSYLSTAVAAEGSLTLINSTLVYSEGDGAMWTISAGVWGDGEADLFVTNSVIVGLPESSPYGAACAGFDTISGGGNIESSGDTCGLTDPTDLVNVAEAELNLAPLADNGGPTITHALLPGSVAIDHAPTCLDENGDPLATDQRGVARPQGVACDAGAFEWADCESSACQDGNVCTAYACNATTGLCQVTPVPDGTPCSPGPTCDPGDGMCSAGVCESTSGCGL